MPADYPQYGAPETPRSFREVLRKTLAEPDYASFIHGMVRQARAAETEEERAEAARNIDIHFKLSDEELTWLELPPAFASGRCRCTETRTTVMLLDFATATPSWPAEESSGA